MDLKEENRVYLTKLREIERKWHEKWDKNKIFEADIIKDKEKFFLTIPYPYMNGKPHLGHLFTFARGEFVARFERLKGKNVLWGQGWHCTGSPIVVQANMVKDGVEKVFKILKLLGVPEKEWNYFEEPKKWITYFKPYWKNVFKEAGFSIDWRREFITTHLNPKYSKFIEWQYWTLKEKGLIERGTHPVVWCPNEKKVVGDHDRLDEYGGIQPEEVYVIKFKLNILDLIRALLPCTECVPKIEDWIKRLDKGEDIKNIYFEIDKLSKGHNEGKMAEIIKKLLNFRELILAATTYRPETVYGVENIWLNPESIYHIVLIKDEEGREEIWLLSNEELKQELNYEKLAEIKGERLLNLMVKNPVNNEKIPILPGRFVKAEFGTGVVMSVPKHAPFDYIALKDLGIEPKKDSLISVDGEKGLVEKLVKKLGIKSQEDKSLLDKATKEVYKKEFHKGVYLVGDYQGLKVSEAKEKIARDLLLKKLARSIYILPKEVYCRCGAKCIVNLVKDQWFLKYSDENWKKLAHECVDSMKFIPKEVKEQFHKVIDWLNDWAATHSAKNELGTPLPWDKKWIIESLSDSTIYMAYYPLAKYLENRDDINAENLSKEFFDYVILGKIKVEEAERATGLNKDLLNEIREDFNYWYPVDLRISGKDLIQNHLTFFIFHHVAIFPKDKWPKMIAVNGHVLLNGEKMSKSKGNMILAEEAVDKWGADPVRFVIAAAGDQNLDDANLETSLADKMVKEIYELIDYLKEKYQEENNNNNKIIEKAFISYFLDNIKKFKIEMEEMKFRSAILRIYFKLFNEFKKYEKYLSRDIRRTMIEELIKALSIFIPHSMEEVWSLIGKKTFISQEKFSDLYILKSLEDRNLKNAFEYVDNLVSDINDIKKLLEKKGNNIKKVRIYFAKENIYKIAEFLDEKLKEGKNFKEIFAEIKKENKELMRYMPLIKKMLNNPKNLTIKKEIEEKIVEGFKDIIVERINLEFEIRGVSEKAIPGKPYFVLE